MSVTLLEFLLTEVVLKCDSSIEDVADVFSNAPVYNNEKLEEEIGDKWENATVLESHFVEAAHDSVDGRFCDSSMRYTYIVDISHNGKVIPQKICFYVMLRNRMLVNFRLFF